MTGEKQEKSKRKAANRLEKSRFKIRRKAADRLEKTEKSRRKAG